MYVLVFSAQCTNILKAIFIQFEVKSKLQVQSENKKTSPANGWRPQIDTDGKYRESLLGTSRRGRAARDVWLCDGGSLKSCLTLLAILEIQRETAC